MQPLDLFRDYTPARRSDPDTSHEAARRIVRSGKADSQAAAVLVALKRWPGSTSAELAELAGLDRYMVARRLPDLERNGLAARSSKGRCTVTGNRALTWEAA